MDRDTAFKAKVLLGGIMNKLKEINGWIRLFVWGVIMTHLNFMIVQYVIITSTCLDIEMSKLKNKDSMFGENLLTGTFLKTKLIYENKMP